MTGLVIVSFLTVLPALRNYLIQLSRCGSQPSRYLHLGNTQSASYFGLAKILIESQLHHLTQTISQLLDGLGEHETVLFGNLVALVFTINQCIYKRLLASRVIGKCLIQRN